jgi:hypothetical protein
MGVTLGSPVTAGQVDFKAVSPAASRPVVRSDASGALTLGRIGAASSGAK